jgi:hypothetical protein
VPSSSESTRDRKFFHKYTIDKSKFLMGTATDKDKSEHLNNHAYAAHRKKYGSDVKATSSYLPIYV